ncbi:Cyanidin-3-O-glucoside 2-O-glucuronosyltransferase [Vitis vinifera]|uniref:Cyanidin-3-O-glucoside 2-O-glucuronosyltransferase n=1 Tax=Vitis vinifera TaxID=29760 RepID=A0A438CB41_VITVI|nr:Cyanidin-3-O-glucoside 2-O-glucuronosyltransferase [Vitis vinifera]
MNSRRQSRIKVLVLPWLAHGHISPFLELSKQLVKQKFLHIISVLRQLTSVASKTLSPDLLIYDFIQPWAPAAAASLGIPSVQFLSNGAAATAFMIHFVKKPGNEFPFPEIYLRDYEISGFNRFLESSANARKDKEKARQCLEQSSNVILIRSFKEIEERFIDFLSNLNAKTVVPVGPLLQDQIDEEDAETENG